VALVGLAPAAPAGAAFALPLRSTTFSFLGVKVGEWVLALLGRGLAAAFLWLLVAWGGGASAAAAAARPAAILVAKGTMGLGGECGAGVGLVTVGPSHQRLRALPPGVRCAGCMPAADNLERVGAGARLDQRVVSIVFGIAGAQPAAGAPRSARLPTSAARRESARQVAAASLALTLR
jgi:hypothetical protein